MMKKTSFLNIFLISALFAGIINNAQGSNTLAVGDSSISQKESVMNQLKLQKARSLFLSYDFRGALKSYRELYSANSADALLNFRIGECYFALKNIPQAIEHLEIAFQSNPEVVKELRFVLGQCYHRNGQLDEAISMFETFYPGVKPKEDEYGDALRFIEQCKTAKELMANPVDVKIINPGLIINSPHDDYAPSISADGQTMIFTSRRPETKGGGVDINDHKFYEDIYITTWDKEKRDWTDAQAIQGRLNTDFHDASLSISPDGKQIFVYKNIPNETRSGDIYVSTLSSSGKWSSPDPLPPTINSSYFESSASLSADGSYLYFVSERRGGQGNGDIYRSKRISKTEWAEAENLGPIINTPEDEISVFMHPDGKTLFFSSNGHKSMGGLDIFKSVFEKGAWSTPVNVGYPINTLGDDLHFILTSDNKTGYYSTIKEDGLGERDIYKIDMLKLAVVQKDGKFKTSNGLSILKGSIVDSDAGQAKEAEIEVFEVASNTKVATIQSNTEGEYFVTLPGGIEYEIAINIKGYKEVKEKFLLPLDEKETHIMVKHIIATRL